MLLVGVPHALAEPGLLEAGAKLGPSWEKHNGDRDLAENAYKLGGAAGVALRYGVLESLAAQLEILYATRGTDLAVQGESIGGFHFTYLEVPLLARLIWRVPILAADGRTPPLSGYLIAGPALSFRLGAERVDDSGSQELPAEDVNSLDFSAVAGLGVAVDVTPRWGASLEARYEMGFIDAFANAMSGAESKNRAIMITLGIDYKFNDSDGDRLVDARDRCSAEAEDWNDYKDSDGCPDADEDGDGIVAGIDQCPEQAENANGYQDQDGCPEADDDNDGVVGDADKCPTQAEERNGYKDMDGCPDADEDGDGIVVDADKCPEQAEDGDRFADEDGCPDPDNDDDGFLDEVDECPLDGFPRMKGCPPRFEFARVDLEEKRIVITPALEFDKRQTRLGREQKQALDQVVAILTDYYPQMHLRLRGHADGEGNKTNNQGLSEQRSKAVASYLISKGIHRDRLVPIGFGEDEPLRREETEAGKRRNRRVELVIIEQ